MRILNNLILCLLAFLSLNSLQAQCPSNSPAQLSGNTDTLMVAPPNDTTPVPVISVAATGAPNTEYLIVQKDSAADDGSGPAIVGTSITGRVVPNDYGMQSCNTLCVMPFSYDLNQIKTIVDSMFNADYFPGTSCCTAIDGFIAGFCDTLNSRGIFSSADVTSIDALFDILGAVSGGNNASSSPLGLVNSLTQLNQSLSLFGNCAGGYSEICYAIDTFGSNSDHFVVSTQNNPITYLNIVETSLNANPMSSVTPTLNTYPASPNDSVQWSLGSNAPAGTSIDPITGEITTSSAANFWAYAMSTNTCLMDSVPVQVMNPTSIVPVSDASLQLSVQPNPFSNRLTLTLNTTLAGEYQLQVINLTGKTLIEQTQTLQEGEHQLQLNTTKLATGSYFIRIIGNEAVISRQVIKK